VRHRQVAFRSEFAEWDGARERREGDRPVSAVERFFRGGGYDGQLSAYSLQLQLINSDGQVVYGRLGGIQLDTYYRPEGAQAGKEILSVPPQSLFHDDRRLDRAIHVATLPLLHSPQEIAAGGNDPAINTLLISDLPPPPTAGEPPVLALRAGVPREQILAGTHRVVVARLVPGKPAGVTEEVVQRYMSLIQSELAPLGWELIESARPGELLDAAMQTSKGLYDPMSGELDRARLLQLRRSALAQLDSSPAPDAILWVRFDEAPVEYHHGTAVWDGASQSAITLGSGSRDSGYIDGMVRALTLTVELRGPDDTVLYAGRGGVQLLQYVRGYGNMDIAPTALFKDPQHDLAVVHRALRELVLTPRQLDAELHPPARQPR
jgi:hypothetical protein